MEHLHWLLPFLIAGLCIILAGLSGMRSAPY